MKRQSQIEISLAILCWMLLAGYVWLGSELRFMVSGYSYHRQLLDIVLKGKTLGAWLLGAVSFPGGNPGHAGTLTLGFVASCLITGVLAWALLGRSLDFGPTVCLFGLSAAIVPTLLVATVFWPDGQGHIQSGLLLSVGIALNVLLALLAAIVRPSAVPKFPRSPGHIGVLWSLAFLVPLVVLAFCTFMSGSIGIRGYDALAYHLPLPAAWARSGQLSRGFDVQCFLPSNMELLLRWIFAGFGDHYVFVVPFFSGVLATYLIYRIGRTMGQSRQSATVGASLAATFPVMVVLSTEVYSDLTAAMLMLLSAFFLLRWAQNQENVAAMACSGLAVGLAAGTKMSILPQAAVIAVMVTFLLLRDANAWIEQETDRPHDLVVRRLHWSWFGKRILFFAVPALAGGYFWYLRSAIQEGNPFYPVAILSLPGVPLKSILPSSVGALFYNNLFGGTFFIVVIPALLFWLMLRRPALEDRHLSSARVIYFLAIASLLTGADAFTTYLRYASFAFLLSYVFTGELWQRNRRLVLRLAIYASFLVMVGANCEFLAGSYVYASLFKDRVGAARFDLPKEVDSLPPGRIFNATSASSTYGLMGADHRHEVVSLFRDAVPQDILLYQPDYVFLRDSQAAAFTAIKPMLKIAAIKDAYGAGFSLWRVTESWTGSRPR